MKKLLKARLLSFIKFVRNHALAIAILAPLFIGVIAFLSRIPSGAAEAEHLTAQSARSLSAIFDNPINAPYKFAVYLATLLSSSILAVRSMSILFFFGTSVALYYTLLHWHTRNAAGLTTVVFATNSIVLAVGRLGTPLVAVFGWFIFASMLLWQVHGRSNKVVPGLLLLGVAALMYTPGAPWFFGLFLFFYWGRLKSAFHSVKRTSIITGIVAGFVTIIPLLLGFVRNPDTAIEWLLLPSTINFRDILTSILEVPAGYIYKMPENALLNVSTLPVFDLASGFLFLIGLNAYRKKLQLDRTRLMIAVALVGVIIGALGQTTTAIVLLLPFAFSMIAAGIEFLLDEWNSVFPKNPFARSFGVTVIAAVILFGAYYQLTRFLVVWPQTNETRQTYDQSRIIE